MASCCTSSALPCGEGAARLAADAAVDWPSGLDRHVSEVSTKPATAPPPVGGEAVEIGVSDPRKTLRGHG
jgi:hypothetical protein